MAKRIEVSPEQMRMCLELHERHMPYTKIEEKVGLDRRKVKVVILEAEKARRFEAVVNARRDVAGAFLQEHIEHIKFVSQELLELTLPPDFRSALDYLVTDLTSEMHTKLSNYKLRWSLIPVMGHTVEEDYPDTTKVVVSRSTSRDIEDSIQGLKEHLPSLAKLISRWESTAVSYNKLQEILRKHCEEENLGIEKERIKSGILSVIKIASEKGISDEEPTEYYSPKQKENIELGRKLLQIRKIRQEMKALLPLLNDLKDMYTQLEDMLSPSQLNKRLIISHCKFCPVP